MNTSASDPPQGEGVPLGTELARLRREASITGRELGERVGMSQAKISKIETGAALPDPRDVETIARALGAAEHEIHDLVARAGRAHNQMAEWRVGPVGLTEMQVEWAQIEATSRLTRCFQTTVLPGLLQTSEYARALLQAADRHLSEGSREAAAGPVAERVSIRVKRQEILADPRRQFHFVFSEAALAMRVCRPEDMPAQLARLRDVAELRNVTVGIVPLEARWICPPLHGFDVFDERCVIAELLNTVVTSRGRSDIRMYSQLFDQFLEEAVTEIDDILDKYLDHYLDMARSGQRG